MNLKFCLKRLDRFEAKAWVNTKPIGESGYDIQMRMGLE